jgi:hypothetical protein
MIRAAVARPPRGVAERDALKSLLRLAYALTREEGDVYVGRTPGPDGAIRLEAWAREVDVVRAEGAIPARLRAEAETAAYELGARLEVASDEAGRKVVFRIEA